MDKKEGTTSSQLSIGDKTHYYGTVCHKNSDVGMLQGEGNLISITSQTLVETIVFHLEFPFDAHVRGRIGLWIKGFGDVFLKIQNGGWGPI